MPETALLESLALRAPAAVLLGAVCGLLLWLLGWLRAGGAGAAAVAVGAAHLGGGPAPGALVALAAGLPGLARLVTRRRRRPVPGAAWAVAGLALPTAALLARPALPADAWVLALATGALAGTAADSVRAVTEDLPGVPRRLHDLRPASGAAGSPPLAAVAGLGAAVAVAGASWWLRLLGPGDPALVTLAGALAMVAAAALRDRRGRRATGAPLAALTAAAVGAAAALGLVAFIP